MTIEELSAHLEIQRVLYRYCRGVDRGDKELLKSVYHPGARDDHGPWKGSGVDFAEYIVDSMGAVEQGGQHNITNILIELDGDKAAVESYFIAFHPYSAGGSEKIAIACGRYLDRFERRDGEWRIADRKVILDVTREHLGGPPWPAQAAFTSGKRGDADGSAAFFLK